MNTPPNAASDFEIIHILANNRDIVFVQLHRASLPGRPEALLMMLETNPSANLIPIISYYIR
jgi:hypothetical protein